MASNFAFLKQRFPELSEFGEKAEHYVYSDPNACLLKLGMMGETIVNLCFCYDHIPCPKDNSAVERIRVLDREGLLTNDLVSILHSLRKERNKAAHENYGTVDTAKTLLKMTYGLCEWFMQTYGDWNYQNHPFTMPLPQADRLSGNRKEEIRRDEGILAQAGKRAEAHPQKVPVSARKAQSFVSASRYVKSEEETRYLIDEALRQAGWEADTQTIRYAKGVRPQKGHNMAIAEWPTGSDASYKGYADYALFIGKKLVGVIEAKAIHKDVSSVIDYQCKDYARHICDRSSEYQIGTFGKGGEFHVPFVFAANGRPYFEQDRMKSGIWFLDLRRADNTSRPLKGWMSPEGLSVLLASDTEKENQELARLPYDFLTDPKGLSFRPYQVKAVEAAEQAVREGKRNILLAMATGTGKTRTILGMMYRFLKTNRFHRILYLVDRIDLGQQAEGVFQSVKLEDLMTLNKIYNVNGLEDKTVSRETRVQVATVNSMMNRILYDKGGEKPSVSDFDLIIVDEAHRGYILDKEMDEDEMLYRSQLDYQGKYRAVIEYFDAVKIGLTATPALHTVKIFGNPVFTYSYREAVIEGYLVDHDAPHIIKTKLSTEGIHYKEGEAVTLLDRGTGQFTHIEDLKDEMDFDVDAFNRRVITEPFNRTVLSEIAKDIDPEAPGKTLIFAANDEHADLIVNILKDIYSQTGVPNDAIMKITDKAGEGNQEKVREAVKRFKNEEFPSIAVTVDLLTTGIDVPSITSLVFLRRVKSRILFEQMLGRATRLCPDIHKTHFDIYDAVGVYDLFTKVINMNPVTANPKTTFHDLLDGLSVMEKDEQIKRQSDQILARMQRKKAIMDEEDHRHFEDLTGGVNVEDFIHTLETGPQPKAKETILSHESLFRMLDALHAKVPDIAVISDKEDQLLEHGRGYGNGVKPEDYLDEFAEYIRGNMNDMAALHIICTRPRDLTRESLLALLRTLDREGFTERQLNTAISQITNQNMVADIITLIRKYAIGSALISHEARIKNAVDKLRKAHTFTKQEENWLTRIENYLMNESVVSVRTFDEDSRFKSGGGFKRIDKIFNNQLESLIKELNTYLYDDGGRTA